MNWFLKKATHICCKIRQHVKSYLRKEIGYFDPHFPCFALILYSSSHHDFLPFYSAYDSVSNIMLDCLGWQSLESDICRSHVLQNYSQLCGLRNTNDTPVICIFSPIDRSTLVQFIISSSYPAKIVLWNKLPSEIALRIDFDSFK